MQNIVFETRNLTKIYYGRKVVNQVNITAYEGEVFGFLGPNGAGKTTTLGMALGLVHPQDGEVFVLGSRVLPNQTKILGQVGALLGAPAFVPYLSARENIELVARLTPGINKKRIDEVIEMVDLGEAQRRRAGKFSTGMKQRLGLAMALVHKPRFVILDEPTNGLDPSGMRDMRALIRSLVEQGTTVLLSSHLLNEVQQVCDRIAVLNRGVVVAQGRVKDLLNHKKPAVLLKLDRPQEKVELIKNIPGVNAVHLNGDEWLTIEGSDSQTVMEALLKQSIVPLEISTQKTDLETLFMDLTA